MRHALGRGAGADELMPADDGTGIWVVPTGGTRGPVSTRVIVGLDIDHEQVDLAQAPARAYGVEMVYVGGGLYWLGDPDPQARDFSGVYRVGGEGDVQGPIPQAFLKGTLPFWVMKYELSQGQYVEFLNELWDEATYERAPAMGRGYRQQRGSIRLDGARYVADHPRRPANFLGWDDQLAYTDWAGLRPMTELEFTQAARGPREPIASEFPWGTASRDRLKRLVNADGDLLQKRRRG